MICTLVDSTISLAVRTSTRVIMSSPYSDDAAQAALETYEP